jgi:hypothetical protein
LLGQESGVELSGRHANLLYDIPSRLLTLLVDRLGHFTRALRVGMDNSCTRISRGIPFGREGRQRAPLIAEAGGMIEHIAIQWEPYLRVESECPHQGDGFFRKERGDVCLGAGHIAAG